MLARALMAAAGNQGLTYAQIVLQDVPIAYWPLDETSGTIAYDQSGNGYNGTYNGSIILNDYMSIPGTGGGAPKFDGSTTYVTGTQLLTSSITNVTLESWVNFETNTTPTGGCFFKNGQYNNGYAMGNGGTDFDSSGNNFIGLYEYVSWNTTTSTIPTSGWHHCVIVIGSTSESTYYIDGAQVATNPNSGIYIPGAEWVIGADDNNSSNGNVISRFFAGSLSNIAIYGTALSATRILAHYDAGIS